jgi:rhamnogalacturonan endolyase
MTCSAIGSSAAMSPVSAWAVIVALLVGLFAQAARVSRADVGCPAVTLERRAREVVLANGLVTASIDPADAEVTGLRYRGHELVSHSGRHKNVYFSRDGGGDYETVSHCTATVLTQTPDTVDLRCSHVYNRAAGDKHAWDVDVHYVLRRGVQGLYVYAVCRHPADYPDMAIGEWRMVWSTPDEPADVLDTICVDPARHWIVPTPADFAHAEPVPGGPKEVSRMTTGTWAGRMDCKYMYSAQYWDLDCWGFADSRKHVGAFVVMPSHEWFNDGPYKQDLDVAVGTTLVHLNMNHYDGTGFTIRHGTAWTKCYGPWLLYGDDGASADDCWRRAQAQGEAEAAQWPYAWVKDPAYPSATQRGDVRGRLVVHDPLKPDLTGAGAWVGLAPAVDADFQFSATGYQFWVHAGPDGAFDLAHVRPGAYTLYAVVDGAVGQFARTGVTVAAGRDLSLGDLTWNVPHAGRRIAWEIGTPDRSAAEFAHGKDYYLPMMFQKLWTETPDPLEFTVGRSDPARDWPYAQTVHKAGDRSVAPRWRVHFTLAAPPAGEATLVLAFAGADRGKVGVFVNGESAGDRVALVTPAVQGGNGLVREAVHTKYGVSAVRIPAGRLRAGPNTITLEQLSLGDASYVMYDAVRLELP